MPDIKKHWHWYALALIALVGVYLFATGKVHAADKGGAPVYRTEAASLSPAHAWNGCGAGVHGGLTIGEIMGAGHTIYPASNGQEMGTHLVCDLQLGTGAGALVIGAEGSIGWIFGDLHNLGGGVGASRTYSGGGRAGVLITPSSLLYGHGEYVWTDVTGIHSFDHLTGWGFGAGIEVRLPTQTPLFLDARYTHTAYDDPSGFTGANLESNAVRVGLTWKFQGLPVQK
jgi:hypothetical protein